MSEIVYDADGNAIAQLVEINGVVRRVPPPRPDPRLVATREGLRSAEKQASERILNLKTNAAAALVSGGMTETDANAAGSAFVLQHAALIQAYILAGGNPVAKSAFLDAIEASPPVWWSEQMTALFAAGL